jgi:polo-like kinase 1
VIIEEVIMKSNGEAVVKQYSKGRFLGKGGFARVYEFTCLNNNQVVAAKIIPRASLTKARAKQKLMSEIKIHRSLHHSNIVGFDHFFEDSENVYILLELCENQNMSEMLRRRKRLLEEEVQYFSLQIISALQYTHANRVIHRDIKLGNLFLSKDMTIKMGDYGLAAKLEFDGEKKRTICGTPNYIAPEILDGKAGHSYEVDVWSFGVVLYTLLVGKPPFETSDVKTTYKRIKANAYAFPEHIQVSAEAKDLVGQILHSTPDFRPTLDDILAHKFFHRNEIPKALPTSALAVPPRFSRTVSITNLHVRRVSNDPPETQRRPDSRTSTRPIRSASHGPKDSPSPPPPSPPPPSTPPPLLQSLIPAEAGSPEPQTARISKSSKLSLPRMEFVVRWLDYTHKYGLGYLTSSGISGVYFNDSTKMLLAGSEFFFIDRREGDKPERIQRFKSSAVPSSLQKKVTLLQHFAKHLKAPQTATVPAELHYVKKYLRTDQAMIFRLSSRLVQVVFKDASELVLASDTRNVIFLDKNTGQVSYPLTEVMEAGNQELNKRLRYTKEALTQMLTQTGTTTDRL